MTFMNNAPQQPQAPQYKPKQAMVFGGNITKDFELREYNETAVVNIDIATEQFNGETKWARVTIWGTEAQLAHYFFRKGDAISGWGHFTQGNPYVNNQGETVTPTEIKALTINLSAKQVLDLVRLELESVTTTEQPVQPTTPQVVQPTAQQPAQEETPFIDITSQDFPF